MAHLYESTGTLFGSLIYPYLDQTLAIIAYPLWDAIREVSHKGRLVLRPYDHLNRIRDAGFKGESPRARHYNVEGGRGSAPDKVTTGAYSSDTSEDSKVKGPKLDIRTRSEGREAHNATTTDYGPSEANQNELCPVEKKESPQEGETPKDHEKPVGPGPEGISFNMLVSMSMDNREKFLAERIQTFWSAKKDRFVNLHKLIFSTEVLVFAYADTANAKRATTQAGDESTLDGMTLAKLQELSNQLLEGSWKPGVSRRVMIPNKKAGEFRPLTIVPATDKIVSNAIKLVIGYIYEPCPGTTYVGSEKQFTASSHGFRPNRGCHSALNVTLTWGLCPWMIQGDIAKCYDTIDQKRLYNIMGKVLDDQMLIDTIANIFTAPVKNLKAGGPDCSTGKGVPQGNPLSPLLANIYLSELDRFVLSLKKEYDKGKPISNASPEWSKATWVTAKELSEAKTPEAKARLKRDLYRHKVKLATKQRIERKMQTDVQQGTKVYHKIHYVRYADDYLIAVKGPKSLALMVKEKVETFLKSCLHFELKGGELTHATHSKVHFLGFDIKTPGRKDRDVVKNRRIISFKKLRIRITNRKKALEDRYIKSLQKAYDTKVKRTLLALSKANLRKDARSKVLNQLATQEAVNIKKLTEPTQQFWSPSSGSLSEWMKKEVKHLREYWIQEDDLKSLGMGEVVDTYKQFVSAMERALHVDKLNDIKEMEVSRIKSNPNYKQMHVDRILYAQPQGLNPRIYAPVRDLKQRLNTWGMLSKSGKPKASGAIFKYHELSIIEFFKQKAMGLLNYYKPAVNYHEVKKLVDYHMRWSLIHTLAGKHLLKVHETIQKYGKTPVLKINKNGRDIVLAAFLSPNDINHRSRGFITSYDPKKHWYTLDKAIVKLSIPKALFADQCAIEGCEATDIEVHHVRSLSRTRKGYTIESIKSNGRTFRGLAMIESSLSRKQIPLCKKHHVEWHKLKSGQIRP